MFLTVLQASLSCHDPQYSNIFGRETTDNSVGQLVKIPGAIDYLLFIETLLGEIIVGVTVIIALNCYL